MTNERKRKERPKQYFKSLLETCPYKLVRLPHSQLVSPDRIPHMTHQFLVLTNVLILLQVSNYS